MTTTNDERPVMLTALDRCDRCQAPARVRVEIKGQPLLFCGHDYNAVSVRLQDAGALVTNDERLFDE